MQKFRDKIGLPPRAFARLIRFDRALRCAESGPEPDWAEIALACGFVDQSQFNRELRSFAGMTPVDFLDRRAPERDAPLE